MRKFFILCFLFTGTAYSEINSLNCKATFFEIQKLSSQDKQVIDYLLKHYSSVDVAVVKNPGVLTKQEIAIFKMAEELSKVFHILSGKQFKIMQNQALELYNQGQISQKYYEMFKAVPANFHRNPKIKALTRAKALQEEINYNRYWRHVFLYIPFSAIKSFMKNDPYISSAVDFLSKRRGVWRRVMPANIQRDFDGQFENWKALTGGSTKLSNREAVVLIDLFKIESASDLTSRKVALTKKIKSGKGTDLEVALRQLTFSGYKEAMKNYDEVKRSLEDYPFSLENFTISLETLLPPNPEITPDNIKRPSNTNPIPKTPLPLSKMNGSHILPHVSKETPRIFLQ